MKVLITGSNGQLGRALKKIFPDHIAVDAEELDITNLNKVLNFNIDDCKAIINAAAYTRVDEAEKEENVKIAETINVSGVTNLVDLAETNEIPLVHVSTDYVFDGTKNGEYTEVDEINPLNIYGRTKAQGDKEAQRAERFYIFRTSWVIGDGNNFVRTMISLAEKGINPTVVDDQFGRLTFTNTLAAAIEFALTNNVPYGVYNLTNSGSIVSWFDIAKKTFELTGHDPSRVLGISTEEYYKDKENIAARPKNSALKLDKIKASGFKPRSWEYELKEYIKKELAN